MKDYYQVLGVSKTATTEEIKKAYRKLAHLHHPDKAGVESDTKFKEINEAYQVLSNTEKRAQYDQFGAQGNPFSGQNSGGWQNAGDFGGSASGWDFGGFSAQGGFGNLGDIFETMFGQAFAQVQTEVEINLTAAVLGQKIDLQTSAGDTIVLNVPSGTQDGTTFRFRGKGHSFKRGRGDLLVTVRVRLPKRMNREQKELFEQLRNAGL